MPRLPIKRHYSQNKEKKITGFFRHASCLGDFYRFGWFNGC